MAEAMELDLSLNQPGKQPIENPVPVPQESIEIEKDSEFDKLRDKYNEYK